MAAKVLCLTLLLGQVPSMAYAETIDSDIGNDKTLVCVDDEYAEEKEESEVNSTVIEENGDESDAEILHSGVSGDLEWQIDSNGKLSISGEGDYACDCNYNGIYTPEWCKYAQDIRKVDLKDLDTLSMTSMQSMFAFFKNLEILNLSNFDTSNVKCMSYMFEGCSSLKTLDLSDFDTSNVTTMYRMFDSCSSIEILDLSRFKTSKVKDMAWMFVECENLKILDLSSFDTSNVTTMDQMFAECSSLEALDLSNFDTSNVTNMYKMFQRCSSLETLDLSNFDTSHITDMNSMFSSCGSLETLDLSSFDTSNVTNMGYMFSGCMNLKKLNLSNFDTSNFTGMYMMFKYCSNLEILDLSNFDTSNVTSMISMFDSCRSLEILNLGNFDTSNVTDIQYMFYECVNLISSITISGNISSYKECFYQCSTEPNSNFEVKYDKNCSKELAQKIVNTRSEKSNVYLEESDDVVNAEKQVLYFSKWDAEKQIAYLGSSDYLGSAVTDKTDTSFETNVDNLVGKYVLASTQDRDDNMVDSDYLISIEPVESIYGKITEISDSSVTINEKTYTISEKCELPAFTDLEGEKSIIHLYDDKVVKIEKLQVGSGTVEEWNKDTGELSVTSNNDKKTYKLSYFTDGENITIPNSGKDVRILCDSENLFYEAYAYSSKFTIGRDNFSFSNSAADFLNDDELKKWTKCTKEEEKRKKYASETAESKDYFPIQITKSSYNKLVDGLDESLKEELYHKTHFENWGGSCYGMSAVMAIRFIEEPRLPIKSIFPVDVTTTNGLPKAKDSENVEDVISFYQLLYNFPEVANGEMQLEEEVKSNYTEALNQLINEIRKEDPVIVAIMRIENGKIKGAHAVLLLGVQEETDDCYKIKVCDPNYPNSFKYMLLYKNKAADNKWLSINYNGSDRAEKEEDTYTVLYNYVSGVETMDLKNYFAETSKSRTIVKYDNPMLKIASGTKVKLNVNNSQLEINDETVLNENIYGPYPEMSDLTSEKNATTRTYFLKNPKSDSKYEIEIEPDSEAAEIRLILNNHSFSISTDEDISVDLDDKSGKISVESDKAANVSLKVTSNEISDEWQYPTVALDLTDTKNATMQVTEEGVELSGDNLKNAEIASKNDDTVKSSEINTDEKEITIADSDGDHLEINDKDSKPEVDAVTNLKASAYGKNKVRVQWTKSANADGYLVYGKRSSKGKYGYIGMTTKNDYYVDNKALDADYNFYWVYPYKLDNDGKKIINTSCKYVYAKGICAGVTNLKAAAAGKNKVKLTWTASANAEGYVIYGRKDSGTYGYMGMTSKTTYTDSKAADNEYNFYWVYPYMTDSAGKRAINTSCKYVYAKGVCTAVTNLKATGQKGSVKLTWIKSPDADGYLIYGRKDSGTYGYMGMTSKTSYIDKKAAKTEYNFYWVYPYHKGADGKIIVGQGGKYVYGKAK